MNLADLRAWLASSQDFAPGVALYAALGTSTTYQRLFALGETDYSRGVLLRELTGLANNGDSAGPPPASPAAPLVLAPAPEPPPPAPVVAPGESPLLSGLYQQLRVVRDERSQLHPQLTASGLRQTTRLKLALRILALTDQEVELKAHVAHVQVHGRLPGPVATADVTELGELRRRLLNARSRRSKAKGQPERQAAIEAEINLILSKITP